MVDIAISYESRFWLFLILNISSILCSFFVIYYFLCDVTLRRSLHNHVIIAILIVNLIAGFTDLNWIIYYYRNKTVPVFTPLFCQVWKFIDSASYTITARLVAWASIERHILIFHGNWVLTKWRRIFVHYLPLYAIILYGLILYIILHFFLTCTRYYFETVLYCGFYSCAYDSSAYSAFEFISSGILNASFIAIFSAGLVIRISKQKSRLQQHIDWRKHRKMTLQLTSITFLFYIFYLPNIIVGILSISGVKSIYFSPFLAYGQFFSFFINFLLPFVCAGTLPHLRKKIRDTLSIIFRCNSTVTVIPQQNTTRNRQT